MLRRIESSTEANVTEETGGCSRRWDRKKERCYFRVRVGVMAGVGLWQGVVLLGLGLWLVSASKTWPWLLAMLCRVSYMLITTETKSWPHTARVRIRASARVRVRGRVGARVRVRVVVRVRVRVRLRVRVSVRVRGRGRSRGRYVRFFENRGLRLAFRIWLDALLARPMKHKTEI